MGKPQKNKSAEKQTTTDETSDEASTSTRLDASSDQDEAPTRTDIMAAINQLNQNVDSKFELLNASIAGLKQSLGEVEQRVISTEGGLNEHETRIKALEDQCSRWAEEASSDETTAAVRQHQDQVQVWGVRCGFRHPATFVVSVGEDKRTFNNPKDAEKFLDDKQVSR
ncbi:hypothetical protein KUCAC02_015091 [Chaenocephalus aceratus]|uniref:Uncharacterized protein n=1 Tax=Chaenocephalus aceratus TaxID=36190 RepID=A0ACB9XXD3_CHAAC|nr:hypothetical protein KUCAC02_015091 [Chaenocephalus aceratus]